MSGVATGTDHVGVRSGTYGRTHDNLVKVDERAETHAGISNGGLTGHAPAHHRAFWIHPNGDEPTTPARERAAPVLASAPAATLDDDEHRE